MSELKEGFKEGYDYFIRLSGASTGVEFGDNYVSDVGDEIEKLVTAINHPTRKIDEQSVDTLKGFVSEWWHEGTFNIDAAVKDSKNHASAPDDNGIVDIFLTSDEKYSSKYYKTGKYSAKEQAITWFERYRKYCADYRRKHDGQEPPDSIEEYRYKKYCVDYRRKHDGQEPPDSIEEYNKDKSPNDPYYFGQGRLIPADQIEVAQQWLKEQIVKETGKRSEQVKRYQEALDKLTDRLKSNDGAESIPLTDEEARNLAKLAKEGGFDPAEWGLKTEELISIEYIMHQAFKAGLSAALVSSVLKIAPKICGIICRLRKEGEIDSGQFKHLGIAALSSGAKGFIRGTVAAAITIACKAGEMGEALKTCNPIIIGVVTAITINTIENASLMALGKMSKHDFAGKCAEDLIITVCSMALGKAGSMLATAFSPVAAVFGYMIGSFVGSVVGGFAYKGAYSCVISFCVKRGSTFFGLVEQNYELQKEILEEIGIDVFEYETIEPDWFEYETIEPEWVEYEYIEPDTVDITYLRRGVIGVGKIGYV